MIEIIQIKKFTGPIPMLNGDTVNIEHRIGDSIIMFRKWPKTAQTALYSILIRNENGCYDIMLTGAQGPKDLGDQEVYCADPALNRKLRELWAPRLFEEGDDYES